MYNINTMSDSKELNNTMEDLKTIVESVESPIDVTAEEVNSIVNDTDMAQDNPIPEPYVITANTPLAPLYLALISTIKGMLLGDVEGAKEMEKQISDMWEYWVKKSKVEHSKK